MDGSAICVDRPPARLAVGFDAVLFPTAWSRADAWWAAANPDCTLAKLVGRYIAQGHYVWCSPDRFVLAAEVELRWGDGGGVEFAATESPDAWYVHIAATAERVGMGAARAFLSLAPRPHPWVVYHRRGSLRVIRWGAFRQTVPPWDSHGKHCIHTTAEGLRSGNPRHPCRSD